MTAGRYARVGVGHLDDRDRDAELTALPFPQHDPPHWPAAGGLNAGEQLRLAGEAAASLVALIAPTMIPNWSEPQRHRSGRWINGTSP
jgi:hypothetical protein